MRIALIQPDSPYLSYPLAFPNLGLLYISAYLKKHGHQVDFYDLTGGGKLKEVYADFVGVSCQITQWEAVKKMVPKLHGKLIIGGPYPTFSECPGFTAIKGEGEIQFLNLVEGTDKKGFVDPNFFPDWDAIDLSRYGYSLEGKRCINIMTKRGNCPYRCAFCAKGEIMSPIRFRTAENVLEECRLLKGKGFGAIAFYDDDVLLDKKRDKKIFKGLKELDMPYRCMTRTNLATEEDLKILKDTGCAEVAIGVETADPKIKQIIHKMTTVEQDTKFVNICKQIGLRVKAYLIIGLPGENQESVENTKRWLKETKPDNFDLSVFTPYPGSDIYDNKDQYDIHWNEDELKTMWFSGKAQYDNCAVSTSHLTSQEIIKLRKDILKEFKRGEGGSTSYWKPYAKD